MFSRHTPFEQFYKLISKIQNALVADSSCVSKRHFNNFYKRNHFIWKSDMSNHCINHFCQSKRNTKLFAAQKPVCNYYNIQYKPYSQVCGICLEKSILHYNRIGKLFKNQECILDNNSLKKIVEIIELSDSDGDIATNNDPKPSTANPEVTKLSTYLNTTLNNTIKPLVIAQNKKCNDYLISKRSKLTAVNDELNYLIKQIDKDILQLYKNIYKFDNQQKFKFDEEMSIVGKWEPEKNVDNDVAIVSTKQLPGLPEDLPKKGILMRHSLKLGDKVYGMKHSLLQPWDEATVKSAVSDTYFNILFNDGGERILNNKNLAYINTTSNAQYPVGSRVIAKFQDMNVQWTNKFYVGIIAEPPKHLNNFRYLIFFDDGYAQYVYHKNIRLVCGESANVSDDVLENVREFVKVYLQNYPERFMVKFNKKQTVRTELEGEWCLSRVINLDASLVQLKFFETCMNNEHTEWIYRGSNRLSLIYERINNSNQEKRVRVKMMDVNKILNRPFIELENLTENETTINTVNRDNARNNNNRVSLFDKSQEINGVIKITEIPANFPKPLPYINHQCSHLCMLWVHYDYNQTKFMNVLTIPLHYGFTRSETTDKNSKLKLKKVIYTTPCGRKINNNQEMFNYLKVTGYGNKQMTIDLFNFDCTVNPLSLFDIPKKCILIQDISYEMEFKSISVVNSLNSLKPKHIKYITERKAGPGVNLNTDIKFLSCCDCTDNCEDKTRCSCWQLTHEGPKNYPNLYKDHTIGYNFKRLHNPVYTGIYECNVSCKCMKTCLNRVVQEPLKTSLQLFLTEKKGWGVRTLADIPKGSFVCLCLGEVRTNKDVENDFEINGDKYLADLDFLNTAAEVKNGYEKYVVESEDESENHTNSSDDEEFNPPGWVTKCKISTFEFRMSLRKNLQNTNTKIDGKHRLSKLNTQQRVKSKHKSLRGRLDKDSVYILDANVSGNIGRYFNHSCDPNIFVQNVFVDTHDIRFPWVAYFASSNISAGTELAWNYNYIIGSVQRKKLMCHCGSKSCKGRLL